MADQAARVGVTAEAELLAEASQKHAASADMLFEPDLGDEINIYVGLPGESEMLMLTDGAGALDFYPGYMAQPDDNAASVELLAEVEGNPHNSIVFAYLQDVGSARPARLLQQSVESKPDAAERIFWFVALDSAYTIYAGYGEAETAATLDAIFLLKKKSEGITTTVATMTFLAGELTPVIEIRDSTVEVGDRLSFHAPALQDATLAKLLVAFVLIFT